MARLFLTRRGNAPATGEYQRKGEQPTQSDGGLHIFVFGIGKIIFISRTEQEQGTGTSGTQWAGEGHTTCAREEKSDQTGAIQRVERIAGRREERSGRREKGECRNVGQNPEAGNFAGDERKQAPATSGRYG